MPIYTFSNSKGEVVDKFFKIGKRPDEVIVDGEKYSYIISSPSIVAGVNEGKGIPSNLKERMTQMKKQNPNMKTKYV